MTLTLPRKRILFSPGFRLTFMAVRTSSLPFRVSSPCQAASSSAMVAWEMWVTAWLLERNLLLSPIGLEWGKWLLFNSRSRSSMFENEATETLGEWWPWGGAGAL